MTENMKDSGIEWIGEIPEEWEISKIKFYININNGREISIEEGDVPVYGTGGAFKTTNNYLYDGESVLLGRKGTIDNPLYVNGRFWTVDTAFYTTVKKDIDVKFFYYLATSFDYKYYQTGSTVPSMTQSDLGNIFIPQITYKEQEAISNFLDKKVGQIDDILADLNKQVDILNQYKKSLITETVTKGLNPDAEMKNSGIDWIGEIPKEWDLSKIKFKFGFIGGYAFESDRFVDETDYQVLRIGNIKDDKILLDANAVYIEENYIQPRFEVKEGYILFTMTGTRHKKDYFYTVCVEKEMLKEKKMYTNQRVGSFYPKENLVPKYFSYLFKMDNLRDNVFLYETGTVNQGNIGIDTVGNTEIVFPPIQEQKEIADYLDKKCSQIDSLMEDKKKQIEKIENYKKSLIYEYVTGKKRVKGV